ncbi:hypothetical protein OEA41_001072 [Lepraria neglecta]|uniref:Uncharacterized protein n=1 Tax=Lepraria neglecta TaxID=209136 RepID=A0AAD9ZGT9_9LECA|nr:hypothetical protein OEA41_001072 [Lepraria neglecta]
MTPDKGKRPLPSSTSRIFPEQPKIVQPWQVALRRIKVNLLHATYIYFYSALSSESIARHAHNLSTSKLQTLKEAKISYLAASSSLPIADKIPFEDNEDWDRESAFTNTSSASEESAILDYYNSNPHVPDRLGYVTSPSSVDSNDTVRKMKPLRPSVIQIRKSFSFTKQHTGELMRLGQFPAPPDAPPFTPPPRSTSLQTVTPSLITFSTSTSSWLHSCAYERYNGYLISFSEMLAKHIRTIDSLIQATQEAQSARHTVKRMASYGDDEEARARDLKARIARLKAAGWRRERFAPERYQDLCEEALAEL